MFIALSLKDLPLGTMDNPGPAVMPLMLGGLLILFALWSLAAGKPGLIAVAQGWGSPSRLWAGMLVAAVCWTAAWALATG